MKVYKHPSDIAEVPTNVASCPACDNRLILDIVSTTFVPNGTGFGMFRANGFTANCETFVHAFEEDDDTVADWIIAHASWVMRPARKQVENWLNKEVRFENGT